MAKLILEGGAADSAHALSDVCRIGRDPANEIALDDPEVSRRHCRVTRDGDAWILEDLRSANGTFRNEERVEKVRLEDGDRIRVGKTVFVFSTAHEEGKEPDEIRLDEPRGRRRVGVLFTRGPRRGERLELSTERVTIGRKPNNDIRIEDPKVSGVHCELVVEEGRPVLRDLGSTNGTFLEGKRIDEVVLDHGDRVRIGDSEFVLVDAERSEPPVPVDDDVSRTLIDVPKAEPLRPRTPARGGGALRSLVVGLVVVSALGGGGWYAWSLRGRAAPPPPPMDVGNRIGPGWSFELTGDGQDPGDLFEVADGWGAAIDVVAGGARSGARRLEIRAPRGFGEAILATPLSVGSRRLRVRAYARAGPGATALLGVTFAFGGDEEVEASVPVAASDATSWSELGGEVVVPSGARSVRVRLGVVGDPEGAVASFDDLGLFDLGLERPEVHSVNAFEFEVVGGSLFVRRGEPLLRVGPARAVGNGDDGPTLAADRAASQGRFHVPGGAFAYRRAFEAAERPRFSLSWGAPPPSWRVEVPLHLAPALAGEAVGVLREGRLEPYREAFEADGVTGFILGSGASRLRVELAPPAAVRGVPQGLGFDLVLSPGAERKLEVSFQVDFVEEKTRAGELAQRAREAERRGRLGEALSVLDRILNEFPFDETITAAAEEGRGRILKRFESRRGEIAELVERARFLGSPQTFLEAEEQARAAAEAFSGSELASAFEELRAAAASERATLLANERERRALAYLERIETALAARPPMRHVALALGRILERRYPDTEAARRARDELAAIEERP